jgi:PhnB protein
MAGSFKPEGYSTVSPYLIAAGAQQVIDFLKEAFGARELRRFDSLVSAELRRGAAFVSQPFT